MKELQNTLRNSSNFIQTASGLILVISATSLLSPQMRWLGWVGLGASISSFGVTNLTERRHLRLVEKHIKTLEQRSQEALIKAESEHQIVLKHNENLRDYATAVESREAQAKAACKALEVQLKDLIATHDALTSGASTATAQIAERERIVSDAMKSGKQLLNELIEEWFKKFDNLTQSKAWQAFPDKQEGWAREIKDAVSHWRQESMEIPETLDGLTQLLGTFHHATDDFSTIKTQILKTFTTKEKATALHELERLRLELQSRIPLEVHNQQIAQYNARLSEFELDFSAISDQAVLTEREIKESLDPFARQLLDANQQLELKIRELQILLSESRQVKMFDAVGWKSEAANRVLDHFAASEVVCDACQVPIEEKNGCIEFYIQPRTHAGMKLVKTDIDKLAESMEIPLGVKGVKISIEGRTLRVRIPVENREVKKSTPEDVLGRSINNWSLYAGSEYHLVIFAATQSGKTSLADELNAMMYSRLNGEIEFHAITLKNDGNRDDAKSQRFVTPEFKATGGEYQEALGAIHEAIALRNQLLAKNPDHKLPREVYQLDEYGEYYRLGTPEEREAGKMALISILQRGAGLSSETGKGISLTCIAQNPQVSNLGLNRPDLANACIIIVGDKNIRLFLDSDPSNHGLDQDDLERLKVELKVYKEAARSASDVAVSIAKASSEDEGVAIRRCPENYYSLVIPSKAGLAPIILYNPQPGQFTNGLATDTNQEKKPHCPSCKTPHAGGLRASNKYPCQNPGCQRKTYTWKGE